MNTRGFKPGVFVSREESLILVARHNPLASSPFPSIYTTIDLVLDNGTPEKEIAMPGFAGPRPTILSYTDSRDESVGLRGNRR